jgi:thiamine-phosphate pyrophosphorylase
MTTVNLSFSAGSMRLIVISPPDPFPDEPPLTARILEKLPVTLHLRKPGQGTEQIAGYLNQVPAPLHPRIVVHGHDELLTRFNLKGLHFTEKERLTRLRHIRRLRQKRPEVRISSAFHRIADIPDHDGLCDYIFLSPIFDSISKSGYRAAFDHGALRRFLSCTTQTVIALGGIDEQRLGEAASLGFKGVAVLGAIWNAPDPVEAAGRLWDICCSIRLQSTRRD